VQSRALVIAAALVSLACSDDAVVDSAGVAGTTGISGAAGSGTGGAGGNAMGVSGSSATSGGSSAGGGAGASATAGGGAGGVNSSGAAGDSAAAGGGVGSGGGGIGGGGTGSGGTGGGPSVPLPAGVTDLFPLPGASNVCADPALRLRFAAAPKLGSSGKLRVFDRAAPNNAVVTVDFAVSSVSKTIGGQAFALPRQVFVDGTDVVVPLDSKALGYGKRFYVTLEAGAIQPANGSFSLTDTNAWSFETRGSAPSGSNLTVALDGTGQLCSWQGALDAVPDKNTAPVRIEIGRGTYHGVVYFNGKQAITLHGADRKQTVLSGVNNNTLNPSTRGRALFGADGASGLVLENLTIQNLTPQGGSQAEALRLQNCDKCVVRQVDVTSLQDTLLWSGRVYAEDCYIAGNVDYVWGSGIAYFNRCEIKTVGRAGYIVQSRNDAGYGYVFVDSKISSDAGISGNVLARIDGSVYPNSHVAFIDCVLGSHVSKAGWTVTGGAAPSGLRFWEYRSKTEAGALTDVSGRTFGKQISAEQAAQMRDKSVVLGGWSP
jgi:pectin methylesterase-like acyl-CoA thioesterase